MIMVVIFLLFPMFLGRKTGRSFMEILVGRKRSSDTKKDGENKEDKNAGKEKNSSKNDLLNFISSMASFSRKYHCHLVFPGALKTEGGTAMLAAVLITRTRAVGFSCFGYAGTVLCKSGDEDWNQTLNGEKIRIKSPSKRVKEQEVLLKSALQSTGYGNLPCEVMGIFTAPKVQLMNAGKANCYTKKAALEKLNSEQYTGNGPIDPKEVGKALETLVVKAGS